MRGLCVLLAVVTESLSVEQIDRKNKSNNNIMELS